MDLRKGFLIALTGLALALPLHLSVEAQSPGTEIFITNDETGEVDGQVSQGDLTAMITHRQENQDGYESWIPTLTVKLRDKTVAVVEGEEAMFPMALVQIAPMDEDNPYPAVLFATYTGGAHCCNDVKVITSQGEGKDWQVLDFGFFNGGPHEATDLDGNGWYEYPEIDNRFLYRFSSYAGSAAPAQILALQNNQVVDVSFEPRFQSIHRENAQSMEKELPELMGQDWEKNGFLAAYVANKALIGELDEGWQTMLKYYDKDSDWGLTTCLEYDDQSNCLNEVQYDSYPDALRAFLVEAGYIDDL